MSKDILTYFLISVTGSLFAQPSNDYTHSISLDPLSCAIRTISISYSYKLNDKYELTVNPKVRFHSQNDNVVLIGFALNEDPVWYYDAYTLRAGIRRNFIDKVYVEPILFYKYASFNNREIKIEDSNGDAFDIFYTMNRVYNSGGLILKSGFIFDKEHFRLNVFYGLGYYLRKYDEAILRKRRWMYAIADSYPIESTYWKNNVSFHLGLETGFKF